MDNESSKPHPGEGEGEEDGDGDEDEDEDGEKARAEELLEDCWYFGNLLHRNMSTNSYDHHPPKTCEETYESIKKLSRRNESGPSAAGLMRSPSLPPCPARKGSINIVDPILAKGSDNIDQRRKSRLSETTSSDKLASAPRSPEEEEIIHHDEEQEEIEFSMGKLIRQASLKKTQTMLPTTHDLNKGGMGRMSTSGSGSTSPRKMEFSKLKLERLRPRRHMNQLKTQKSLSDLQSQELQGFKDLGFDLSKTNLRQQEHLNPIHEEHEGRRNTSHPTPANWGSKEDDMKAQIKFWARAVASNMR